MARALTHPALVKFAKHWALNFIIGSAFLFMQIMFYAGVSMATHATVKGSLTDLGTGFGTGNPLLVILSFVGLEIAGVIMYVVAYMKYELAEGFSLGKGTKPKFTGNHWVAVIATLFAIGVITSLIFSGMYQFIQALSPNTNIASLYQLYMAVIHGNVPLAFGIYVTIAVFGFVALAVSALIEPISKRLPKA